MCCKIIKCLSVHGDEQGLIIIISILLLVFFLSCWTLSTDQTAHTVGRGLKNIGVLFPDNHLKRKTEKRENDERGNGKGGDFFFVKKKKMNKIKAL